ncbi:class II glutamine amidotransferase [Candidatus Dojkabacteria bacterium]|uniref:Class II glutamine amidotransferase n=1 Tax=Candidatus Dojkabacteria bacterium TaxID=2099670 RepID=A0A955L7E2_9BACT|nr:class II glutamine amidotransferase [Candidatus Dojkabacteria bacterium]
MCRILAVQKTTPTQPQKLLYSFAEMCKKSRTPDGDRQGDGWGIAWLDEATTWKSYKSTSPVWEDTKIFEQLPETRLFIVHARSKSFETDSVDEAFNQPYLSNTIACAFNGELHGVMIPAEGKIGAEKIFSLVQKYKSENLTTTLQKLNQQLDIGVKEVIGSNIVVSDSSALYALCKHWGKTPDYHTIRYIHDSQTTIICSEIITLEGINNSVWKEMSNGEVIQLSFD